MKEHIMRHFVLIVLLALSSAVNAATPSAEYLKRYYTSGQVCICIQFAQPVCNDIVWCGTYNGWSTSVDQLATFQPVEGFDSWYVVAFYDNNNAINGKPVQLKSNGSFDWKYQTGNINTWQLISGDVSIENNQPDEAELRNIGKTKPLILVSTGWKNEMSCVTPAKPEPSKTLPVLYINTENKTPITSKDDYVKATYYLDNMGLDGYQSIASKEQPDTMQIKGRGNYTWSGFDKKPYRLKLNNKQALMGLEKNKHWTLLAHADDQFGWLKNTVGFYMSEQLGMRWTPKQAALEVVLNGDYIGLYMLTEQIRVDKKRVNVVEQEDEETDAGLITGGWLVEIDNYEEPYHITLTEPENQWHHQQTVWITPNTPEILSMPQSNYLQAQMETINSTLYANTETDLVKVLDMKEAAKYYLVCELMSDCESYHGSCYLHKEHGDNQPWFFGPVWDFGNSFRDQDKFIYDQPTWSQVWIGQLAGKKAFIAERDNLWKHWKYYDYADIEPMINTFAALIKNAAACDAARWPRYDHSDVISGKNDFLTMYKRHVNWLTQQWGEGKKDDPTGLEVQNTPCRTLNKKVLINGQLFIIHDGVKYDVTGRK